MIFITNVSVTSLLRESKFKSFKEHMKLVGCILALEAMKSGVITIHAKRDRSLPGALCRAKHEMSMAVGFTCSYLDHC